MHKLFHLLAEVIYEDPQLHPHMTEEEIHNQNFERIHKKKEKPQKSKK